MSKLAKKPIPIPPEVKIEIKGDEIHISGKAGVLSLPLLSYLDLKVSSEGSISVTAHANHKQARANLGTMASLLTNAIEGVTKGFSKSLEVEGIGFRASLEGTTLVLTVGFSHPVRFQAPPGVKLTIEKNVITVSGVDKQLVGEVAAQIRRIKKPEPYKGKGIHYSGEIIRRKAGKKVAGSTAGA